MGHRRRRGLDDARGRATETHSLRRARRIVVTTRASLAVLAVLAITVIGGQASGSTTAVVHVPAGAGRAQIDAALARAAADGPGTTLVFPAGRFTYDARFTARDGINITGAGIWKQGVAHGGGGTWLRCRGLDWGSDLTVSRMLVGENVAGVTSSFRPVARGDSAAGADTKRNGSHDVTFEFVRFKGGSDSGAALIDLGSNFGSGLWSAKVRTDDMVDTTFNDCEFERPQTSNAVLARSTALGDILNIWLDCRKGGAQVHDLHFNRCHFGVGNGYHSGVGGYGLGTTILFQPAPAEHATDGPRPAGRPVNMHFNWSRVDHGFRNITFTDCLFEYGRMCPMDVCDYARSYSLTHIFNGVDGSNPPTAAQAAAIPDKMWTLGLAVTRCYFKGSCPDPHSVIGEIGKDCTFTGCYCGTGHVFSQRGKFGNLVRGAFSNATRPCTALFRVGWRGRGTTYTPSPFDPRL